MIQKGGKEMRSKTVSILVVLSMFVLLVAACGPTPEAKTIIQTVEVEKEVKVVETMEVTVVETVEVEKTVIETVEVQVTPVVEEDPTALPRNETLYFNGLQWGPAACWNPYSSSCNNPLAINEGDSAGATMFETPYLFNMLDGGQYPLLADGPYTWNDERTEITFKLKDAAMWSDGTPVTAEDVAYTWATHVKYNTNAGAANGLVS
jgi:peptide/nickel transport system substrate-binding protein